MAKKKNTNKSIELSREAPSEYKLSAKDIATMKVMTQKQIEIIIERTPEYAIKTRPGSGGRSLRYVPHGYVTFKLNQAFGFDWDYKLLPVFDGSIVKHVTVKTGENKKTGEDIITHYISVYGELTVRIHNPQKPAEIIATITKPGPGSSIWFPANEWGDALKSAKSDGLKVAAHELGIALDLYWDDEAEFSKFEKSQYEGNDEIIEAIEENNHPTNAISAIARAKSEFGYDLPKLKSILGDNFVKEYTFEMWDKLSKHYEGEKKS